jgi:hypothetical protein
MGKVKVRARVSLQWLRCALCLLCLSLVGTREAGAVPVLVIDGAGQLTGALGVDVGGTLYDVTFVDGSCAALFSGCDDSSDYDFATALDAVAAAQALLDQVFVDSVLGNFDSDASLTFGCHHSTCNTLTPYGNIAGAFLAGDALQTEQLDIAYAIAAGHGDYGLSPHYTFARWSAQPVAVPEPATLLLFGVGALGLGAVRRARRN